MGILRRLFKRKEGDGARSLSFDERRIHQRAKLFSLVRYDDPDGFASEASLTNSYDISEGGVCFYTSQPLQDSIRIQILIHHHGQVEQLSLSGTSVWYRKVKSKDGATPYYQVAVAFDSLREEERSFIREYVGCTASKISAA